MFLGEVDLQGRVKLYMVKVMSNLRNYTQDFGPDNTSAVFENLTPNTIYTVTVTITIHGGASITSDPVTATTHDGGKKIFFSELAAACGQQATCGQAKGLRKQVPWYSRRNMKFNEKLTLHA